ncbi:MAG: ATP-dependent helicase [Mesorhizobium sp.]
MTEKKRPLFVPQGIIATPEQIDLQTATQKVVVGEANAGAAKTTTIALRIGEALAHKSAPGAILALAFTPEARDVLRQRLLDLGLPKLTVDQIEITTFDDFASKTLAQLEGTEIKTTHQARRLRTYACEAIDQVAEHYVGKFEFIDLRKSDMAIADFLNAQLRLKAKMAFENDFEDGLAEAAEAAGEPLTDFLVAIAYERIRLGNGDHPLFRGPFDATYDLARLLGSMPGSGQIFAEHRVVVCDEMHDMNEATFRILSALISRPNCFFTGMGDKHQVIHAQLGASHEYLDFRFKRSFPNLKSYPLTNTYRHGPHLAYAMRELMGNGAESNVPRHTEIMQSHYDSESTSCADCTVAAIKSWKRDGFRLDDCAILIRDRHQSIAIENALIENGIGYRTQAMGGYMQRDEVLFLRGMMAIALNGLESVKSYEVRTAIVESLALFGEVEDFPRLEKAKYEIAKNPDLLASFFKAHLGGGDDRSQWSRLATTIDYVLAVPADTRADVVLRNICNQMEVEAVAQRLYVRPYDVAVVSKSIKGFLEFAEKSALNLRDFWTKVNAAEVFASRKREKDFVFLDCVANAKGKEFEHVIMPFLEVNEFPNPMFAPKGEKNLFYVGATRTKRRLTLISPSDARARSAYIRLMKISGVAPEADLAITRNESKMGSIPATRVYLKAGFDDRVEVKSLGARFDDIRKKWYVQIGTDLKPFARWLE